MSDTPITDTAYPLPFSGEGLVVRLRMCAVDECHDDKWLEAVMNQSADEIEKLERKLKDVNVQLNCRRLDKTELLKSWYNVADERDQLKAKVAALEADNRELIKANAETWAGSPAVKLRLEQLEADRQRLVEAITTASEMHLGRCVSSEPFKAVDYRNHACDARDILRAAITPTPSQP